MVALVFHHRYVEREAQLFDASFSGPVAVSPSMGTKFIDALCRINSVQDRFTVTVAIDVAHGDREEVLQFAKYCVDGGLEVWSGNIATAQAAIDYYNVGVRIFKVGIGGGAACSTRIVSGCGAPTAWSIKEIKTKLRLTDKITIIADGGIKNSGDIVKALALGADAVVCGRLLAGVDESAGQKWSDMHGNDWKEYRGMASSAALSRAGKRVRVEGVSGAVPATGKLKDVLNELVDGIKTGMAYVGARTIPELQKNAEFTRITHAAYAEGLPRI